MSDLSASLLPRRVLVFGAARGYVGTCLVPRLLKQDGIMVRAAARSLAPLEARNWPGVELVQADALALESLPAAMEGVDTAYYLVHSMGAGKGFSRLDRHAAENFARAAEAAGVRCIVYLGGLFPENADSEHLLSRRETGITLREGPVPVIEVRAGIIVGPGSAAFEIMRDLVLNLPVMVTPKWVRRKSLPIALENLLEYLVRLPQVRGTLGRIFEAEDRHEVQAHWSEGAYPMRGSRREHAFYAKRADGMSETAAPPDAVWRVVGRIGGRNRYYGADLLWWLRETLDWMLGGPGRHRGRRDPDDLRVGDHVDSRHVVGVEPARRLTLMMGMKAWGSGVLEFDLEPLAAGGTRLTATAYWHPAGLLGLLYWYALFPAHLFIFDHMTRNICRLAEERSRQSPA